MCNMYYSVWEVYVNNLIYIAHISFYLRVLKLVCEKCDKNISNENYTKLNYSSKMKEFDEIVFQQGLFGSIKSHLCLTKEHLDNPEGQMEVVFLSSFIYIMKNNFY